MLTRSIYHCHTNYCGDCDVPMEDSVAKALSHGFSRIGFSVHTPWPHDKPSRISNANFQVYVQHVARLKRQYAGRIDVLCGIEGEYDPLHHAYFAALARMPGVDFMSFGLHYLDGTVGERVVTHGEMSPAELELYAEQWIAAMGTGLYLYAVHPDYFMLGYGIWDENTERVTRRMIAFAKQQGLTLGYDMKYRYSRSWRDGKGIPHAPFWKIAIQEGAPIHVELDAHDLDNDWREMIGAGEKELKAMGATGVVTRFAIGATDKENREL